MRSPIFQVDAFATALFKGNPAAVCPLEAWLPDELMQSIAAENNLAETAFFVRDGDGYKLRWFTPTTEVDLCGHATLAAAAVVFHRLSPGSTVVTFHSQSGPLTVTRSEDVLTLDFPGRAPAPVPMTETVVEALGAVPTELFASRDLMAVFGNESDVRALRPRFDRFGPQSIIATAPGDEVDFVSRFFAPNVGIPEDPVTGSAHCTLVPFWSRRLGRRLLRARQVSQRGGELFCEDRGDRVGIGGRAVFYLEGSITFP